MLVCFIALLVLPVFIKIHHPALYYKGITLLIPVMIYGIIGEEKLDQKFFHRWQKAREQGFWPNVLREGLRALVFMTVLVAIAQFFGNGHTPLEIVALLPGSILIWLLLLLLTFSLITGIAAWYENNKKYNRIYNNLHNSGN